jgi:hypothetical protein
MFDRTYVTVMKRHEVRVRPGSLGHGPRKPMRGVGDVLGKLADRSASYYCTLL